jgi:hypothetical protein
MQVCEQKQNLGARYILGKRKVNLESAAALGVAAKPSSL